MANFDLSALALEAVCPGNEILYDDKGMPSVMVKLPKMSYADLGIGSSTNAFPAWIVNGEEKDYIWISKYQNIVENSRAYSLPGRDPKAYITFDQAIAACTAKGDGWHLMTRFEWAALVHWCQQNGVMPKGNNYYGKHSSESLYKAIPSMARDSSNRRQRVATGTGPLTWSHDQTPSGIWDLCGNVWEWIGGVRTVYGELQILVNNNAADAAHSQAEAGTEWMALSASDGSLITPNGSGTTSGSIKMDWVSSKLTYAASLTDSAPGSHNCTFANVVAGAAIGDDAKLVLQTLGVLPVTGALYSTHQVYFNNAEAERCFHCGGYWYFSAYGIASFNGSYPRSLSNTYFGFRSAYVEL